ncbi:19009_t:CDS:10 [Cetraspora pellucida]|uniref:Phosphoacetylglucosamine mutase n=2 Tax=Gigasporaceae TaxID=36753 RepID=A0A9N8VFR0_9GLOM|nr:19009_t:CDS:10 [Cetraspora pellucida]
MAQIIDYNKIKEASAKHPKLKEINYTYGTAGFRMKAEYLESVIFRVGILAGLRSKKLNSKVIGIMVTASHNPEADNGVKLVDPNGEMLEQRWEGYATQLANAQSEEDLITVIKSIVSQNEIDESKNAIVVYARDTRPSGPKLIAALEDGIKAINAVGENLGIKTTPQLHYFTNYLNCCEKPAEGRYEELADKLYYEKFANAFYKAVGDNQRLSTVYIDAANGVGAPKLRELAEWIDKINDNIFKVTIINDDINARGKLNFQCGADYVKTGQNPPLGLNLTCEHRAASLDGDADRIVFYYVEGDGTFRLLDGDKIAALSAGFIIELVKTAGLDINVGVVQTAYANGSSTAYLEEELKVPVSCVPTGVKHLHHKAQEYDVGVYFEANGHGTILFSSEARTAEQETAVKKLQALSELINQTVGDALSDLLFVESILMNRQWSFQKWNSIYTDMPNRLVKVVVSNRHIFKTTNAERTLVEPKGLQEKIDKLVAQYKNGRSFVRPSGTEDVVRVYAEASTREDCDELAFKVAGLVYDEAGGTGGRPSEFFKIKCIELVQQIVIKVSRIISSKRQQLSRLELAFLIIGQINNLPKRNLFVNNFH